MALHGDFETRSRVNLKDSGMFRYAEDPSTQALIFAFAIGRAPVVAVDLTQPRDEVIRQMSPCFDAIEKGITFTAHNSQFERLIWTKVCDFPIQPRPDQWDCTAARSRMLAIPGSLDGAASALGVPNQKDPEGKVLIDFFCKPRKDGLFNEPEDHREKFERFIEYCKQDVEVERDIGDVVPMLTDVEARTFALDYKINDTGIKVNMDLVNKAAAFVEEYSEGIMKKAVDIAGCRPTQREKTLQFLASRGVKLPNLQAPTVEAAAKRKGTPPDIVELLDHRIELSRAGTKKLKAIQNTVCPDGRIRGGFLYSAASTRRWSSTGVQLHNLQKPEGESNPEALFQVLAHHPELLPDLFDRPLTALAQSIRGFFESDEQLLIADYSSVEPKGLAWLSGEEWILDAYRNKQDLYKIMASRVYGMSVEEVDSYFRFMGKQLVLGCFAPDTLVITNRGSVPITHVLPTDKLWDGQEWVSHDGVVNQGEQDVISVAGVHCTPDHEIYTADGVKTRADQVNLLEALEYGSLPDPETLSEECLYLRKILHYDPITGKLSRRDQATGELRDVPARFDHKVWVHEGYRPHCKNVIWEMVYGQAPDGKVDSIDGDVRNLRLSNLRLASKSLFAAHRPLRTNNTSGLSGVAWNKPRKKWEARACDRGNGKHTILGLYDDPLEAARVRDEAAWKLYGVYARLNLPRKDKSVYDILNAGPRNRFTILSECGPLVVSNCGYGMGAPRFIETCAKFGTVIDLDQSKEAVYGYRGSVPNIVKFWRTMERACVVATREWRTLKVGKLKFRPQTLSNGYRVLFVDMPSGSICYPNPSVGVEMWAGEPRDTFEFYTPLGTNFVKIDTFGGSLVENVTQALTRDILRDGLLACDEAGHKIVGHVHDEAIGEGRGTEDDLADFEHRLNNSSPWAKGFPIATEGMVVKRYQK